MIVEVTQEHIDRAVRLDPWHCPIALALLDCGVDDAAVDGYTWDGYVAGSYVYKRLTARAQHFADLFDDGTPVKPSRFRL